MSQTKLRLLRAAVLLAGFGAVSIPLHRYLKRMPSTQSSPVTPGSTATDQDKEHELKVLQTQLEKKPGHAPVLLRMAELARETGKVADAARYLREAVAAEPANGEARLELGRALFESGDVQGAIEATKRILDVDPKDPDALYNLGAIYANTGDFAEARKYWSAAVHAAPESDSGKRASESMAQLASSPHGAPADQSSHPGVNSHGGNPHGASPLRDVGEFMKAVDAVRR
jgi:cytochrome c-type biogenesis protein CcmH/NrfG